MKELKGRKFVLLFGIPFGIICVLLGNPYFAIVSIIVMIIGIDEFTYEDFIKEDKKKSLRTDQHQKEFNFDE